MSARTTFVVRAGAAGNLPASSWNGEAPADPDVPRDQCHPAEFLGAKISWLQKRCRQGVFLEPHSREEEML